MHRPSQPAWPRLVTGRSQPPPEDVGGPAGGEQVIEVQAAAPGDAEEFLRAPRRLAVRRLMAPAVAHVEGANDVGEVGGPPQRPGPARRPEPGGVSLREHPARQGQDVKPESDADGPADEQVAE